MESRIYAVHMRQVCYQGANILRPRTFKCGVMISVTDGRVRSEGNILQI